MKSGSRLRPPPRRRFALRAALIFCVVLLSFPVGAVAYPCDAPQAARTLNSVSVEDCRKAAQNKRKEREEPNLLSLALFMAAVAGVLLIPINYTRRSDRE